MSTIQNNNITSTRRIGTLLLGAAAALALTACGATVGADENPTSPLTQSEGVSQEWISFRDTFGR